VTQGTMQGEGLAGCDGPGSHAELLGTPTGNQPTGW
jgi:hypothetical protein